MVLTQDYDLLCLQLRRVGFPLFFGNFKAFYSTNNRTFWYQKVQIIQVTFETPFTQYYT